MKETIYQLSEGVHLRQAKELDAQAIMDFAALLFASTDQVLTTPQEYHITLEQEVNWIKALRENKKGFLLIAEKEGKVIGLLDFCVKPKVKMAHTGEFGMSVHPDFQSRGIGKAMLEALLKWANHEPEIEKVMLQVFATNSKAIALYIKCGFKEEGRQLKAIKQANGDYVDLIQMGFWLKE